MMLITSVYGTGNRKTLFIQCESEKQKKERKNPRNHCLKDRISVKKNKRNKPIGTLKTQEGSLERVFEQRDLKGPGLKYWD